MTLAAAIRLPEQVDARLCSLPNHAKILRRTIAVLFSLESVVGLCVSGSVASGSPDELSDLDLAVVVNDQQFEALWQERFTLEHRVAPVVFRLDLDEVASYSTVVYYTNMVKVHFTFMKLGNLHPHVEYSNAIALFSRHSGVELWLRSCRSVRSSINTAEILHWDERFWFWMLHGVSKLQRGETWAALDALHTLRLIIVGFYEWAHGRIPEGFRRLEQTWPSEDLQQLGKTLTLPKCPEVGKAYVEASQIFLELRRQVAGHYAISWNVTDESIKLIMRSAMRWLTPCLEA